MRVLVIANRARLLAGIIAAFRSRGHHVRAAERLDGAAAASCDLVLMDLDDVHAREACRALALTDAALIGVVGRGQEWAGIAALREGADDFVVRPVQIAELLARADAVLRRVRVGLQPPARQVLGRLCLDLHQHEASIDGERVRLTPKEFQLLTALARASGTVVTRDQLMTEVWFASTPTRSRTLDSHIAALRAKIGPAAAVENVRGVGYRLA